MIDLIAHIGSLAVLVTLGFLVATLRRRAGIVTVLAILISSGLLLAWLSARSATAAIERGVRFVDHGPMKESWAILAGFWAAGAVAVRYALRDATSISPTSPWGEGTREAAAWLGAFILCEMAAAEAISPSIVAILSAYMVAALCILVWRRRRNVATY
jgi:hypothetical protein